MAKRSHSRRSLSNLRAPSSFFKINWLKLWMKLASKSKHQKPNEEPDIDAVAKNINDLPEAILEHILSFVPMKHAVAMCVLSKKWRFLWTSHPNLELSESSFSGRKQFTNFVDRVLVLQGSSPIKQLILHCSVLSDASHFNLWVSIAVTRNVKDCSISLSYIEGNLILPYCLFNCATLTRLDLCMRLALKLPSQIWLPNLKCLILWNITFVDKRSTEQLLSGPVLEELSIYECNWDNLEALTIRAPMLKILSISDKIVNCSSDCSEVHPDGCQVLICGNNLERIFCCSPFLNDYLIEMPCSLREAHIYVHEYCLSRTGRVAYGLLKLLQAMCSAKTLTLSCQAIDVLRNAAELCSHLPVFPNLKILEVGHLNVKCRVLSKLLHNSPHLEWLGFYQGIELYASDDDEDGAMLDPAPCCFGSHLREIELHNALLHEEELGVLGLLLKHAVVLEKLTIWPTWDSRYCMGGTKKRLCQRLLEMPRGSSTLEIELLP